MNAALKWIRSCKYAEVTGETDESLRYLRNQYWIEGVHWKKDTRSKVWINIEAVERWLDELEPAAHEKSRAA